MKSVEGTYLEGSWDGDGFLVQWADSPPPPSCSVTIHGVFANNGYSVSDFGITLSPADHHAVHLAKNGKISIEPVGDTAFKFVSDRPGEWHYKLEFTFHCSAIGKSQWFFWLNQDRTYTAKPVIISIGGDDGDPYDALASFLGVALPMIGVVIWFKSKSKDYDYGHNQSREDHKEILRELREIRDAIKENK